MARSIQWVAVDGTTINLTDAAAGYRVQDASTGLNAPAYRFTTTQYAGVDGVSVQAISADARDVALAMMVQATSDADFRARVAALTRAMRPKAGMGRLVARLDDGTARSLNCYYSSGLEGDEARGTKLAGRWWKFAVHFLAEDPWWLGDTQTVSIGLGTPTNFFPFFPLVLASSTVQGRFAVDLSATDTPAFPVWTITGPGSSLVLTNNTTGRSLTVGASLASGETMVVDTRPGYQSVRRGDGTNLLGSVDGYPDLWPLAESVNSITAALNGATSNSRIVGSWAPRYAGI